MCLPLTRITGIECDFSLNNSWILRWGDPWTLQRSAKANTTARSILMAIWKYFVIVYEMHSIYGYIVMDIGSDQALVTMATSIYDRVADIWWCMFILWYYNVPLLFGSGHHILSHRPSPGYFCMLLKSNLTKHIYCILCTNTVTTTLHTFYRNKRNNSNDYEK